MNFVLMAFSGVFNPVESLPGVFQPIAKALPSTHAFIALRQVLDGRPLPGHEIWVGAVAAVVWLAAGVGFSTWMLRIFRNRGFVTRFS
jgi:ABC-type multidrug transport system permease subunit